MVMIERLTNVMRHVLGTSNDAVLKRLWPLVRQVTAKEASLQALDDAELRQRSLALREKVLTKRATPDGVLTEAFALAREAADRRIGMWNAIDPARGKHEQFPVAAWGTQLAAVEAARAAITAGTPVHEIDLSASVYAAIRTLYPVSAPPFRMRAHDVQVLGAIVLHQGRIAEMKTGEGKTLVASLTCYLNALAQTGVHVITVNDYLASRDAEWNAPALRFLGVTIGAIQNSMPPHQRKQVYACDITYGTNNEFGFDYLRDNLARELDSQVQTRRTFAIVDEVDSVLIDEARVPLIISGPAERKKEFYAQSDEVARQLEKDVDFEVDIKDRHITFKDEGIDKAAKLFGVDNLYDAGAMHLPHYLDNALKAHHLFLKDKEYLVVSGKIQIVDEHTGRILAGRRWSDGLHQAIEAKEHVAIEEETQTYATITLQNFFRLYDKLGGMTGTALTEANEFNAIYKLEVAAIPPNRPVVRNDLADLIFGSEKEKFEAICNEVEELHAIGQPMLIGTISVDVSERLAELFTRRGIPHNVLNARQHLREAEIVIKAGRFGAVTIATNMAGRGTDIVLGHTTTKEALDHWKRHELAPKRLHADSPELDEACVDLWLKRMLPEADAAKLDGKPVAAKLEALNAHRKQQGYPTLLLPSTYKDGRVDVRQLGGLRIIGTERHDSRRIDNQLRGRSGRQGDPGSSRFYLSLDDDLMKRFAGPTMSALMRKMGLKDGVPIESGMVSRAVEKAQKRVEEYHYSSRKNLLEYDQVANQQRTIVYGRRQKILEGKDLEVQLQGIYRDYLDDLVQQSAAEGVRGNDLATKLAEEFGKTVNLPAPAPTEIPVRDGGDACRDFLLARVKDALGKRKLEQAEAFPFVLRFIMLDIIDRRWKDHLYMMDHLRHAISLEGYAQKDPRMRYKEEGYRAFQAMNGMITSEVARLFFRVQIQVDVPPSDESGPAAALAMGGFQPRTESGSRIAAAVAPSAPASATASSAPAPPTLGEIAYAADKRTPAPTDPCPCGSGLPFKHCHGK